MLKKIFEFILGKRAPAPAMGIDVFHLSEENNRWNKLALEEARRERLGSQ